MAQSSNNNNSTDNNENGIDPRRYRQSTQRKQKQNSQKDVNNDKNGKFVQRFGWNKIVEKKYIPEEYYSFAGCSSSLFSSPKFNNSENQQFLRRQSPSKNIRVITPTKQPQLQRKQKIKEITNKNFQKNKTKNDFNKNKNPKVFRQQNGEETNQNGLNKYNNSNQKGSLLKLNNNIQDNHRLIRQSSKPLIPLKEALQINGKANELSRLYGQFNSLPNGIPPNAICLPRRRRHRPKCSSLAEVNEADLSINEGEQLFTRSLVGVILKSPLEENSDGNINNSCVEFLIYCVIKKRFNTIVQLKADGMPPCIPPGSWIRIILTNAVSHKLLKSNTILIPKKVLFCQRRVMTRCFDGQVSFAVTATRRNDICNENKFVYHSRLCDLLIDKEELIDPLIKIFGKQCEINNNNLKNEKENDDIPTKIRLWCFPFIENKEDSQLEFKLKHIDERYYTAIDTTENEYINDEKQIIINSSNDDSDCNNLNEQQQFSINFCKWFSECIERFYIKNKMNNDRKIKMDKFINLLNKKLQNNLDLPNEAKLILFGSAISGFGSNDCDLDICLINCGIDSSLNPSKTFTIRRLILSQIATLLRKDDEFMQITAVLDARTPIVKFEHLPTGFHGDLSVDNTLAIHNSELLKLYTEFDERVAPLGFAIKCWAKLYGINDASTGSISSYAYIVMLIYYLQRCSPPILPFLQQEEFIINNNSLLVNKIVEGWKVYYTKDINLIKENFKSKFTNKQTLAELFLNFLHFYGFKFSFISNIAQIRANGLYDKIQANISIKRKIYVEDPFDLNHNLTSGVSSETLNHFIKCCQQPIIGLRQLDKEIFSLNETKDDENNKLEKEKLKMVSNYYFKNLF